MHSPGPWKWGENRYKERRLLAADGTPVLSVENNSTHLAHEAHVEPWSDKDARLIAAAPRMLELLRRLVNSPGSFDINPKEYLKAHELLAELDK